MQCLKLRVQSYTSKTQTAAACASFIRIFQTMQCHISGDSNLDASSELILLVVGTKLYRLNVGRVMPSITQLEVFLIDVIIRN